MMIDHDLENERAEKRREYLEFLDDELDNGRYSGKVKELGEKGGSRVLVNINDVREKLPKRANLLLTDSVEELRCFQDAVKETVKSSVVDLKTPDDIYIGLEGSFGRHHVNPRTLKARFLGSLVCCEGIVTKCSLVCPKIVRSVHYCPATSKTIERRYTDLTSYDAFPSSTMYPTTDENKNPLETEFGLSTYKDHQTFSIQELPETAPAGQLPRSVDVVADSDLADMCKPGDRVRVVGLYRCLPSKQMGYTNGTFRTIIIANNVQLMGKESRVDGMSRADVNTIRRFSSQRARAKTGEDMVTLLSRSLAPSIHGHDEVKLAILCLLLGGVEKVLANGTRLRGDVNVLLLGDPSVAKSQLLRYVLHAAARAVATTGRGSSGVGLTAAVTTDSETGERRLEAGAMVLADRGVVCIDEFDKMSDVDRTAIHEVMEQGRVSIAKAGIHAKLNARCAVLAAANPVYGLYDPYKTPMDNIGMQDSLLSRFDLLFIMLDEHDAERDKDIAEHVVNLHQFRAPGESDGAVLEMGSTEQALSTLDIDDDASQPLEVFEKKAAWAARSGSEQILTTRFLRKYIQLAKEMKPKLTDEAAAFISEKYADLRASDEQQAERERTQPVTARMLETMIRLSTAMARARMSKDVEQRDAEQAFDLLYFACFKEKSQERKAADQRTGKKRRRPDGDGSDGDEDAAESGDEQNTESMSTTRSSRRRGGESQATTEPDSLESSMPTQKRARRHATADADDGADSLDTLASDEVPAISVDRFTAFRRYVRQAFDAAGGDGAMSEAALVAAVATLTGAARAFRPAEVEAALARMADDNALMRTDDQVILI